MPGLKLSFACGLYDRMTPLFAGDVSPEGIELQYLAIDSPRNIFDRMAGACEFDAAEMSCSEFIVRMSAAQCPFVAIPVFPSRQFRTSLITINVKSGIRKPKDLEGKRVGVPLYTQTAAIWNRGFLQHECGVDLSKVHWVQGAINTPGAHGEPTVLPLVKPVPIEDNTTGKSLSQLLDERAIDAIVGTNLPDAMRHNRDIQRLFPDFREMEKAYYKRTRIFPIMHLVAIRKDIYEKHPFVAQSLYRAMCQSKDIALAKMRNLASLRYMLPWLTSDLEELDEVFGGDPWPYGVEANRPTLEALVRYMVEQYLIAEPVGVDDIFVPVDGSVAA